MWVVSITAPSPGWYAYVLRLYQEEEYEDNLERQPADIDKLQLIS